MFDAHFWIGFVTGFIALIIICFLYVWLFPVHVKRGATKFEEQRRIAEHKELNKKAWKLFYTNDTNFKKQKK